MTDDVNDDFDIDTTELDMPADAIDDTDDGSLDEDFGLSYDGLTQAEIDAINADDGDDEEVDTDNDSDATDDDTPNEPTPNDTDVDDADTQDDWQAEAATVADKRNAIDAEFDAKHAELAELGEQYDNGDILDGAYNTAKVRIERD